MAANRLETDLQKRDMSMSELCRSMPGEG
jgi:hypothetical protein